MLEQNLGPVGLYASLVDNSSFLSAHSRRISDRGVEVLIVALPTHPGGKVPDSTLVQRVAELGREASQLLSTDVNFIKLRIVMDHSEVPKGYDVVAINPLYNFG